MWILFLNQWLTRSVKLRKSRQNYVKPLIRHVNGDLIDVFVIVIFILSLAPGWAKRPMKSSPLQIERIWRSSLMHLRQDMVPRAQEPPLFSVQMELVFWLTKKLSWKDGLSTLMVFLIGHHLSMMKLSKDYHRLNVICCLMSSQPSLKQWKQ